MNGYCHWKWLKSLLQGGGGGGRGRRGGESEGEEEDGEEGFHAWR